VKRAVDGVASMLEAYRAAFVRNSHELVLRGHARLVVAQLSGLEETEVTGKLCDAMEEVLDSEDAPAWATTVTVVDDQPESVDGKTGKRRPRTDVCVRCINPRPAQRFRFETKRLHDARSLNAYLGNDGMMALVTGYYGDLPHAGMIGYVQTGTYATWRDAIQDKMRGAPQDYNVEEPVTFEKLAIDAPQPVFRSKHVRSGTNEDGRKLITHTLLLCA
jgi:hypothetical protein